MAESVKDPFGLVGATQEGRFAIDRVVARGGFGVVYQGRHLSLRKTVAVKVLFIPKDLGPDQRRLFLDGFAQEAQTIAQLEHPAIVRVLDFGVSRDALRTELPWMLLEWVEGKSLADHLRDHNQPMSPAHALGILRPVFQALAFAHGQEKPVAHRDVKPSNIMLLAHHRGSQDGLVGTKILDFGIAKVMNPDEALGTGETRTEALLSAFSLPYAAPEQKAGLRTGPWTDVHALGLILTEMLTGRRPYGDGDRLEVETQILSHTRPTPARFGIDAGPWEAILAKAVARRPTERFQNARDFLTALEATTPTARLIEFNQRGMTEPMPFPLVFGPPRGAVAPTQNLPLPPAPPEHSRELPPVGSVPPGGSERGVSPSTITDSPTISTVAQVRGASRRSLRATVVGVGLLTALTLGAFARSALFPPKEPLRAGVAAPARGNPGSSATQNGPPDHRAEPATGQPRPTAAPDRPTTTVAAAETRPALAPPPPSPPRPRDTRPSVNATRDASAPINPRPGERTPVRHTSPTVIWQTRQM